MKLFIGKNNQEIQTALDEAQKSCKTRFFTRLQVENALKYALSKAPLNMIPKTHQKGIVIKVTTQEGLPNAYKNRPQHTEVTIECFSTGWAVTKIERVTGFQTKSPKNLFVTLRRCHEEVLLRTLRSGYSLAKEENNENPEHPQAN